MRPFRATGDIAFAVRQRAAAHSDLPGLTAIQSIVILSEAKDLLLLDGLTEKQILRYAQNDS